MTHPFEFIVNGFCMAINDRLREERERLRLSQADFAEKAGIHRNTQARYELGKREPDSGYLETIKAMGVDVDYVLFGFPDPKAPVECPVLQSQGIDRPMVLNECRGNASGKGGGGGPSIRHAFRETCPKCPKNPIKHGVPVDSTIPDVDGRLLEDILEEMEAVFAKTGITLSPPKKSRTTVMLYRAFRASGKVDPNVVKDAVSIAS
jgi:transcriptional regulator with XRE-family HTH domain